MINDTSQNGKDLATRLAEFNSLPLIREDDPEWEMGEADFHAVAEDILRYGLAAHLADDEKYKVFRNMNLYYQPKFPRQFLSPDVMVVTPTAKRRERWLSYRLGEDGPAPIVVAEVLSEETAEQGDLDTKVYIYAMIGVSEYILVDETGKWLSQRLLLKRLTANRTWKDEQDADGGVTSKIGCRVIWDSDGRLRVVDSKSKWHYVRPEEANARAQALEAENSRLREAKERQHRPEEGRRRKKR
jgi:Uma2 family endonuclease